MVRTAAVYVFPAALIALVVAPARGAAGGRAGLALGRSCSRSRRRSRRRSWLRLALDRSRGARRRCGSRSTRPRPTTGPASSCRSPAVRGRLLRLLRRRRAVHGARAAADARRRRPRDLRLLPRARARVAARRPLPAVLAVIAGAGWPATLYPVDSVALRRRDPRRPRSGCSPACGRAARPGARRRGGARPRGRAAPRPRPRSRRTACSPGSAGTRTGRRGSGLGQLRLGRATTAGSSSRRRRRPSCASAARSAGSTGARRRSTSSTPTAGSRTRRRSRPASRPGRLPNDPLLPTRSLNPRTWVKQEVEVGALRDAHIIGGGAAGRARGAAARRRLPPLGRGRARLRRAPARAAVHGLQLRAAPRAGRARRGRGRLSAGARPVPRDRPHAGRAVRRRGRDARVDALFDDERYLALWPYEGLWNEAKRLRAGARTPYGAVVAIETWLRETGGFAYDESPPPPGGLPPLAHFVTEGKRGYCQHFAGAMALMLRFLGIPARVAAGFTSGKREDGGWTVTDHNAHAWVEVWFPELRLARVRPDSGPRRARRELQRLVDRIQRRRRGRRVRPAARRRRARRRERARAVPAEGAAGGAAAGGRSGRGRRRRCGALAAARGSCSWPAARSAQPSSSGGGFAT